MPSFAVRSRSEFSMSKIIQIIPIFFSLKKNDWGAHFLVSSILDSLFYWYEACFCWGRKARQSNTNILLLWKYPPNQNISFNMKRLLGTYLCRIVCGCMWCHQSLIQKKSDPDLKVHEVRNRDWSWNQFFLDNFVLFNQKPSQKSAHW